MTNFEAPIPVSEIESILAWVDTFKLSRCTRKINRDFSDAVLLAEILYQQYPKLIEIHNYPSRNSHALKLNNWMTLNRKVLKKLKLNLCYTTMEQLANATPGYIERLLIMVRDKINRDEEANKAKEDPLSSGGSYHEALGDEGNVILIPVKNRINGVLETIQQKVINYNTYLSLKEELRDAKEANDVMRQKVEHLDNLLKIKEERVEELQKQLERKVARRKEVEALCGLPSTDIPVSNKSSDQINKKQVSVNNIPSKTTPPEKSIKTSLPDPVKPNEKNSKTSIHNLQSIEPIKCAGKPSRTSLHNPSDTAKETTLKSAQNGATLLSNKSSRSSIPVPNEITKLVEKPSAVFYIPDEDVDTRSTTKILKTYSNAKEEIFSEKPQKNLLNDPKVEKVSVEKIEVPPKELITFVGNDKNLKQSSFIEVKELKKLNVDTIPSNPKIKDPISSLIYFNEAANAFDDKNTVFVAPPTIDTTVLNVSQLSQPTDVIPNQNYTGINASKDEIKSLDRVNSEVFEEAESVEDISHGNERESEEYEDSERDFDDEPKSIINIEDTIKKEIIDITDNANKIDQVNNIFNNGGSK